MRELDKGLEISLKGPQAQRALEAFQQQMTAWGLRAPPSQPLVLDFGLGDFARVGLIETWIANEVEAGYCGKYLFVFDGQTCPMHRHRQKHETFFLVKGCVSMLYDGVAREMRRVPRLACPAVVSQAPASTAGQAQSCSAQDLIVRQRTVSE